MKKLTTLIVSVLMMMSLCVNAFAASPDDFVTPDFPAEYSDDATAPIYTAPDTETSPDQMVGIPPRAVSNWLSQQIRLEFDYAEVYGTLDDTIVHLRLSDATKIIFIADQLCPTEIDENGDIWVSDISIPCGINDQLYRYLATTSRAAAMYDADGVTGLMARYTPEELAKVYDELREAAMPYHGELIDWLDNFSVTIRVPNYGTLWNGITVR